ETTLKNVESISVQLKELTTALNSDESSVGQLLHDPNLYNNLNNAAASLDSLLIDVKKNPKRYISIKLL
ncbi:MAG: MCE family protein, partial [Muribaculaceae bacterium]|nr:MCE family protein [Muribaculaceae bacterium]